MRILVAFVENHATARCIYKLILTCFTVGLPAALRRKVEEEVTVLSWSWLQNRLQAGKQGILKRLKDTVE